MKKKKLFMSLVALLATAGVVKATSIVFNGYVVNESAVAYSKSVAIDLSTGGTNGRNIDQLSVHAVYSSATIPTVTFTNGGRSTGSVTVSSINNLLATKATAQITVTSTSTLKNATITINGKTLREGYDWFTKDTVANTATDIARIVTVLEGIDASASGAIVSATAAVAGAHANAYTLAKFGAGLSVSAAVFSGGKDNAYVSINGVTLTQGTDWTAAGTASGTAKAISDAIMANSSLNTILVTTWTPQGIVRATSTVVGAGVNYSLAAAPTGSLSVTGALMTGGSAAAYSLNQPTITVANHGLTTAMGVLYSSGGLNVAIGGLTNQTTYFAIPIDANSFKLSNTSTGAQAGIFLTLTSTSIAGPNSFTLRPLNTAGTFGFKWQYSNDGSNWLDLNVASVTFASPYTASSSFWDFGTVAFRHLRANITAGTAGGMTLRITGYGKNTD